MRLMRMTVGTKLYAGFGVVLVLLLAMAGVAIWATSSMAGAAQRVRADSAKAEAADSVRGFAAYIHESQTRFVLTRNASYADHEGDVADFQRALRTLASLSVSRSDRERLARIRSAFATVTHYDAVLHAEVAAGRVAQAVSVVQGPANDASDALYNAADYYRVAADRAETAAASSLDSTRALARAILIAVVAAAVLFALACALLLTRSITRPLAQVMRAMRSLDEHDLADLGAGIQAISRGDLTLSAGRFTEPIRTERVDEFGAMIKTFDKMLDKTSESLGAYNDMRETLADMLREVSKSAASVSDASVQMASTSQENGRAATDIARAIEDVAHGAERQAQMIDSARASVQEATALVRASSEQAGQTAQLAARARETAQHGLSAAAHADEAMRSVKDSSQVVSGAIGELAARSEEIGAIVQAIAAIAEQTNLLALNAAIEAARAGEHGRGFAVVADEVKKLAGESQVATREISGLIGAIQAETARTVTLVDEGARQIADGTAVVDQAREAFLALGRAVDDIATGVEQIAAAAEQASQSTATTQQSIGEAAVVAERSSAATEEVSSSTEQTSASTQQIAASAAEMADSAATLRRLVAHFQVDLAGPTR